jgi:ABC-type nitrate/sulfonate/bicarbonate transport system substrate-binding protein
LYHLHDARKLVKEGIGRIYQPMDWIQPDLSHALLVVRRDFLESRPETVQRMVDAYVWRIVYERSLSLEQKKRKKKDGRWNKGLMMVNTFDGMAIPQYNYPPRVSASLLDEVQALMLKHKYIDKKMDMTPFVDNRFVDRIYQRIENSSIREREQMFAGENR